jgi:NAD(P)-dependent dehydrogenase (short-subunit alcohol dehydrogenase family)
MGFGGATAHLFVREGAKVVLTDIRDDLGERAAAALRAEAPPPPHPTVMAGLSPGHQ